MSDDEQYARLLELELERRAEEWQEAAGRGVLNDLWPQGTRVLHEVDGQTYRGTVTVMYGSPWLVGIVLDHEPHVTHRVNRLVDNVRRLQS